MPQLQHTQITSISADKNDAATSAREALAQSAHFAQRIATPADRPHSKSTADDLGMACVLSAQAQQNSPTPAPGITPERIAGEINRQQILEAKRKRVEAAVQAISQIAFE